VLGVILALSRELCPMVMALALLLAVEGEIMIFPVVNLQRFGEKSDILLKIS
jgi:hypothetical protein